MTGMEHAIEQAARVLALTDDYDGCFERIDAWTAATAEQRECGDVEEPMSSDDEDCEFWRRRARALADTGLLAPGPLEGVEDISASQEWVMIPAGQVHDEWAVERPDPVDHQPRYDRFPTLDAALSERWGNDRAVHRVATGWEPVDPDAAELEGRENL